MRILMIAAAALAVAAPARAQIALEPGQALTLQISTAGDASVTATGHAELGRYDKDFIEKIREAYKTNTTFVLGGDPDVPPVESASLDVRFVVIDGKESVLILENGYDEGLTYRATISANGKSAPTDVCLVMPNKRGYEHWPYPIDRIALSAFRRVAWKNGDPLPCA